MAVPTVSAPAYRLRRILWCLLVFSCLVGAAAVLRRMVALTLPPSNLPQLHDVDAAFQNKAALTWVHISCGLLFVILVPLQFVAKIRIRRPMIHRWVGRVLVADGVVAAVVGIWMVFQNPIGGASEVMAILTFGALFLFALLRGFWCIRHGDKASHREWLIRAAAVALGVATVRPIMGVFFATSRLTGLTPHDFFGTAFWIGFTINTIVAEAWIRHTRPVFRVPSTRGSRIATFVGG
jgi:hypothetical protein